MIKRHVEAIAFFIDNPEAMGNNPTVRFFIGMMKERINQELERRAKGLGTQRILAKA